jgi:hypothetical protein
MNQLCFTIGVFTVDETAGFAAGFIFGFVLSKRKHFLPVADFALHRHIGRPCWTLKWLIVTLFQMSSKMLSSLCTTCKTLPHMYPPCQFFDAQEEYRS